MSWPCVLANSWEVRRSLRVGERSNDRRVSAFPHPYSDAQGCAGPLTTGSMRSCSWALARSCPISGGTDQRQSCSYTDMPDLRS